MGLYFLITSMDHGVAQNTGVGAMMPGHVVFGVVINAYK